MLNTIWRRLAASRLAESKCFWRERFCLDFGGGFYPPFYPFFVFSAWLSGFLSQAGCPINGVVFVILQPFAKFGC